jgi:hypothetical protein
MARTTALTLSALAFAASGVHTLPSNNNIVKPTLVGDVNAGRFSLPAVKINNSDLTVRPRYVSSVDIKTT